MITREQACDIALKAIGSLKEPSPSIGVGEVLSWDELGFRSVNVYVTSPVPQEQCWVVYLDYPVRGLESSRVMLISKADGEVVYWGSAGDEG